MVDHSGRLNLQRTEVELQLDNFSKHANYNSKIVLKVMESGETIEFGVYEFSLHNYVKAYEELNYRCMEMCIEFHSNLVISYEVYV